MDLSGELDAATCPQLDQQIEKRLRDSRCRQLVVDLGHLGFFAACGLTSLLRARKTAAERRIDLRLVVSSEVVARPMALTGMTREFTIYRSRAAARRSNGCA